MKANEINGRKIKWDQTQNQNKGAWIFEDSGTVVPTEVIETAKKERREAIQELSEKVDKQLQEVAKEFDVKFIAALHMNQFDVHGVFAFGEMNQLEEMGLGKLVEQKYLQ